MSWDPIWETVYQSRAWGQYPGEDVIRFVKGHFSQVSDRAQVRLLEVGSGAGANLWFMAREGFYGSRSGSLRNRRSTDLRAAGP